MVVGFNHNFSYKGQVYHVQTEDSGIRNPHIITLLYRGGTILASKKTSYADIIKVDSLETIVEELMKAQHREMLRLLKNGDFDELLGLTPPTAEVVSPAPPAATKIPPVTPPPLVAAAAPVVAPAAAPSASPSAPIMTSTAPPPLSPRDSPEKQKPSAPFSPAAGLSLDEIILSYMIGEENKK